MALKTYYSVRYKDDEEPLVIFQDYFEAQTYLEMFEPGEAMIDVAYVLSARRKNKPIVQLTTPPCNTQSS